MTLNSPPSVVPKVADDKLGGAEVSVAIIERNPHAICPETHNICPSSLPEISHDTWVTFDTPTPTICEVSNKLFRGLKRSITIVD
jgi:hypothetical protein